MLVTPKDVKALKAIEKMLKQEIPWVDGAPSQAESHEGAEARPNGNGKHRRGNRAKRGKRPGASGPASPQHSHTQKHAQPPLQPQPQRSAVAENGNGAKRRDEHRGEARREPHKPHQPQPHHGERKSSPVVHGAPAERQANVAQAPRGKQQGMGDHVPAFMMRPVRVT
jgi:superfamily II DNA/RNA helicase